MVVPSSRTRSNSIASLRECWILRSNAEEIMENGMPPVLYALAVSAMAAKVLVMMMMIATSLNCRISNPYQPLGFPICSSSVCNNIQVLSFVTNVFRLVKVNSSHRLQPNQSPLAIATPTLDETYTYLDNGANTERPDHFRTNVCLIKLVDIAYNLNRKSLR
jgi:hypothetical protein